jgi:RNA polymerase sigma-70 factor (ECF subfamily)
MARSVAGRAAPSSTPDVERQELARPEGMASSAPANDAPPMDVILLERRINGLLAAEYRELIAYSRHLTANGPEAADLVHIVFARVLSQPPPAEAVRDLSSWLRTVLFHTFVDLRRRQRWEIPTESAALDRQLVDPVDEPSSPAITMDDLRALVSTLPSLYRVPYEMFAFCDMPYARIATALGLSITTVGTRINRARQRLRRLILARQGG